MIRCTCLMLLFSVLTPLAAQKIGEVPRVAPTLKAPRAEALEWTSAAGQPFWYRLPKKISEKRRPNLVLMFHGTGGNHGWAFWNYGVANGGFRKDDIVVSPEGLTPGANGTFNFTQVAKDGDQIAGIIRAFRKEFPIDRVYLYGHSQGAFFTYWFAGAHTPLVDGFVAHAGNVLAVDHNAMAKKKLAVGILHGRADAVVSVECAYRTERIYREKGYRLVKLEVVEGLNERTGHWPLPEHVTKMFEWLDAVTASSARSAADAALAELAKEKPELGAIVEGLARARRLEKKAPKDQREALATDLASLDAFVERAVDAHAAVFADVAVDAEDGPWLGHFRAAHAALESHPRWKKAVAKLGRQAAKDEKAAAKVVKRLGKGWNAKAFKASAKFLRRSRLARSWDVVAGHVERRLGTETKGIKETDAAALAALITGRREHLAAGLAAAGESTAAARTP